MHPSRLRLGPCQSRPLTDASPGSARSPGLRVCRAAPSRRGNIHTHAPFRTERQSFLRCRDRRLTIARNQRSGHDAALPRQTPQVRILSGAIAFNYLAVARRFADAALSAHCPRYPFGTRSGPVRLARRDSSGGPDARRIVAAPDGAQEDVRLPPVASASPGPNRTPPAAGEFGPGAKSSCARRGARSIRISRNSDEEIGKAGGQRSPPLPRGNATGGQISSSASRYQSKPL
jgi:hypothetical protein